MILQSSSSGGGKGKVPFQAGCICFGWIPVLAAYICISLSWDRIGQLAIEISFLEDSKDKEALLGRKSQSYTNSHRSQRAAETKPEANGKKSERSFLLS